MEGGESTAKRKRSTESYVKKRKERRIRDGREWWEKRDRKDRLGGGEQREEKMEGNKQKDRNGRLGGVF